MRVGGRAWRALEIRSAPRGSGRSGCPPAPLLAGVVLSVGAGRRSAAAKSRPSLHRWLWAAVAALLLHGAGAQECVDSAGDENCASYVSTVGGQLSHCESTLKDGLRVEDVCAQSCGRCGTLLEANGEPTCFASEFQAGLPFYSNCCQVVMNFPEVSGDQLVCSTGDCEVCWG